MGNNRDGVGETEVEPTEVLEAAEVTSPPCYHSIPFARTLAPGWARDLYGKPPVQRPTDRSQEDQVGSGEKTGIDEGTRGYAARDGWHLKCYMEI